MSIVEQQELHHPPQHLLKVAQPLRTGEVSPNGEDSPVLRAWWRKFKPTPHNIESSPKSSPRTWWS